MALKKLKVDLDALRDAWFAFERQRKHEWAREWLESIGLEAE
jgi:hypothetical protein